MAWWPRPSTTSVLGPGPLTSGITRPLRTPMSAARAPAADTGRGTLPWLMRPIKASSTPSPTNKPNSHTMKKYLFLLGVAAVGVITPAFCQTQMDADGAKVAGYLTDQHKNNKSEK